MSQNKERLCCHHSSAVQVVVVVCEVDSATERCYKGEVEVSNNN
jgi:hypothetical protein